MKKIFPLIMIIGMLILIFMLFHGPERASGAAKIVSLRIEEQNEIEQSGPPWLDEAWHYRRPVIINSSAAQDWYQVLITLDSSNFNFNLAKTDGSDIRFTLSDGWTELYYWKEYWNSNSHLAYLWVRVSPLSVGDTTIYLYYNNPAAPQASNGVKTFNFFDDLWCQFPGAGCTLAESSQQLQLPLIEEPNTSIMFNQLFRDTDNLVESGNSDNGYSIDSSSWITLTVKLPSVSSGNLILNNGTGIKTKSTFQPQIDKFPFGFAVGFRANYGSGTGHEWTGFINGTGGQQTMIGDLPSDVDDLYLINYYNAFNNAILEGVNDWHNVDHTYEVRWKYGMTIGDIDHNASIVSNLSQVPNTLLPVTLYNNNSGSDTTLMVDWVYVRQYHDPEPTFAVGAEQGLVDLGIGMVDSPDPLHQGAELTYLLTVSNYSSIDAPGVIVTDTLPGSVQFVSVKTSPECSQVGSEIVCSLNTIPAYLTSTITIVVKPTADGVITNSAIVDSPGFDLDTGNNWGEATTLVDTVPPNVNWEEPALNGEKYTTYGGSIALEASATDNNQVAWVEFWLWDHLPISDPKGKISIGFDNTYPYQMQFNSDLLVPNQDYQMFVQAADRAGNISDIYTLPYPRIYIERILLYFVQLPIAIR